MIPTDSGSVSVFVPSNEDPGFSAASQPSRNINDRDIRTELKYIHANSIFFDYFRH